MQRNGLAERLLRLRPSIASVRAATRGTHVPILLLITFLAVMVHGYHLGADDAAIYVPAIKKAANPGLYPFGAEFFMSHAHWTLFPKLVGGSARLTRMPADLAIFLWHVASVFLMLWAAWRLLSACFESTPARWCGVALIAGVLSVPVAGTALVLMDPYLTARSLSTPAAMFAVAAWAGGKRKASIAWLLAAALIHPQMGCYVAVFLGLAEFQRRGWQQPAAFAWVPFGFNFRPAQGAAREALLSRTYFFVTNWAWYEWVGIFAPLALLWWLSRVALRATRSPFRVLASALVPYGILFTAAGAVVSIVPNLENFARLQPLRAFHLLYGVLLALLGGLIGEYVLRRRVWRWMLLFAPLAAGMWLLQRDAYPSSAHVEWPGARGGNDWTSAFFWIRDHTPKDAVFALDPDYMARPGEDQHGFRAIAERSVLADNLKDSGAVSLFPKLADAWKSQVMAQTGLEHFGQEDFQRLTKSYPVTWVLTRCAEPIFASCPYQSGNLAVCRLRDGPTLLSRAAGK